MLNFEPLPIFLLLMTFIVYSENEKASYLIIKCNLRLLHAINHQKKQIDYNKLTSRMGKGI